MISLEKGWSFRFDLDVRDSLGRRLHPDALLVQEDRNLVMGPQDVLDLDSGDDLDAAYAAIREHRPLPLGRFLIRRRPESYWTYQAVVHHFELRPTCRPGDVRRSLMAIFSDAARRGLRGLAAEPLGAFQSKGLTLEEMVEAFDAAILESSTLLDVPVRLTLLLEDLEELEAVSHLVRSRVISRASRSFRTVSGDAAVVEIRNRDRRYHFRFVPGSLSGYLVTCSDVVA